jgi:hypothetical protein
MKYFLHIATLISIITYLFWNFLPIGSFYIGNALFISMLCMYIFSLDKKSFIKFVLFSLSLNNLLDELLFDNTKLGYNELIILVIVPLIWLVKNKRNARKILK